MDDTVKHFGNSASKNNFSGFWLNKSDLKPIETIVANRIAQVDSREAIKFITGDR